MAIFNLRKREIQAKIVYYGPGLSGKTTNLQYVHEKLKPEHKGELMTLATQTDRTLFFDFLPIELGEIRGLKTRFQLYTVPGQVFYNSTRKLVLKNADGVVFVADSRAEALNDNLESLRNLEQNLEAHNIDPRTVPLLLQYNKRDMPTAMSIDELNKHLNPAGAQTFSAEAHKGIGVLETLSSICKAVIRDLRHKDPQNFRSPDDTGIHTKIAPPAEPQVAERHEQSAPSPAATESDWTVLPGSRQPYSENGTLFVPISIGNGRKKLEFEFKISLSALS